MNIYNLMYEVIEKEIWKDPSRLTELPSFNSSVYHFVNILSSSGFTFSELKESLTEDELLGLLSRCLGEEYRKFFYGADEEESNTDRTGRYPYIASLSYAYLFEEDGSEDLFFSGERGIDIGCGAGHKLIFLNTMSNYYHRGMVLDGIEVSFMAYLARRCLKNWNPILGHFLNKVNIIRNDAMEWDFSKYDRIYTYMPVAVSVQRFEFYNKIMSTLKKGTIWMEVMRSLEFDKAAEENGLERLPNKDFMFIKQ